jgi:hypothetical protein
MKTILKTAFLSVFALGCLNLSAGERAPKASLLAPVKANSSKEITDGGFFFHIGGIMPSKGYMLPKAFTSEDLNDIYDNGNVPRYGTGVDFELGNMFKIAKLGDKAIGLRATWFGANLATRRFNDTTAIRTISATVARVGPYFSMELNKKMALDLFYQIGLRTAFSLDHEWSNWDSELTGFTHEAGVGYRFDKLSLVLGYNFGHLTNYNASSEMRNDPVYRDFTRARYGALRFAVGIKV